MARKESGKKSSWLPTIVAGLAVLGVVSSSFGGDDKKAEPDTPTKTVEDTVTPDTETQEPEEIKEAEEPDAPETAPPEETPAEAPPETPEETTTATAAEEPAQMEPEAPAETAAESAPKSRTVYITKTGKRYHYDNHCNNATYYESDLDTAVKQGLTPCKKCVG